MRAAQSPAALSPQFAAIVALAEHHAGHPDTRPLLEDLARRGVSRSTSNSLRKADIDQAASTAIGALATAYPNDRSVFDLTLRRAELAQDPWEVGSTYFTLMKAYHDRPETISLLVDRARGATHPLVRESAINALAKYPAGDPGVLPVLIERAKDDEDRWPRCAALRALATLYAHEPSAEARTIKSAASDSSEIVRQTAVKMLGLHFFAQPARHETTDNKPQQGPQRSGQRAGGQCTDGRIWRQSDGTPSTETGGIPKRGRAHAGRGASPAPGTFQTALAKAGNVRSAPRSCRRSRRGGAGPAASVPGTAFRCAC